MALTGVTIPPDAIIVSANLDGRIKLFGEHFHIQNAPISILRRRIAHCHAYLQPAMRDDIPSN